MHPWGLDGLNDNACAPAGQGFPQCWAQVAGASLQPVSIQAIRMLPASIDATTAACRPSVDGTGAPATQPTGYPPAYPDGSDGPALDAAWLEEGFVPQGQGYDASNHQLLSTYNNGESVRLALQSSLDGSDIGDVVLGGSGDFDAPTKGGGVATDGEYVYVADTGQVYVYRRDAITGAAPGETVPASDVIEMPEGHDASFLNIRDGKLYVGEFASTLDAAKQAVDVRVEGLGERASDFFEAINPRDDGGFADYFRDQFDALNPVDIDVDIDKPQMLVFDIADASGQPTGRFDPDASVGRHTIPFDAQGVAITDTGFLFTRAYGSKEYDVGGVGIQAPRELVFQPFDGGDARVVAEIDYYAEGVNIVGDEVWITYESNATGHDADTNYRQKYEDNTGRAPDNDHVQRLPLDSLDLRREDLGA